MREICIKQSESGNNRRKNLSIVEMIRQDGMVARAEKVAARSSLIALGRVPACQVRMALQVVRLVPSVREFLRDDDNASFCTKGLADALTDVGLIRDDRREWLRTAPLIQDGSTIC